MLQWRPSTPYILHRTTYNRKLVYQNTIQYHTIPYHTDHTIHTHDNIPQYCTVIGKPTSSQLAACSPAASIRRITMPQQSTPSYTSFLIILSFSLIWSVQQSIWSITGKLLWRVLNTHPASFQLTVCSRAGGIRWITMTQQSTPSYTYFKGIFIFSLIWNTMSSTIYLEY